MTQAVPEIFSVLGVVFAIWATVNVVVYLSSDIPYHNKKKETIVDSNALSFTSKIFLKLFIKLSDVYDDEALSCSEKSRIAIHLINELNKNDW